MKMTEVEKYALTLQHKDKTNLCSLRVSSPTFQLKHPHIKEKCTVFLPVFIY